MSDFKTEWQGSPVSQIGQIVQDIGQLFRDRKDALGPLVALEIGNINTEDDGVVQEFIDTADFAVGTARPLQGQWLPLERTDYTMSLTCNHVWAIAIFTAFNSPCGLLGWNTAVSIMCGYTKIFKVTTMQMILSMQCASIMKSSSFLFEHKALSIIRMQAPGTLRHNPPAS